MVADADVPSTNVSGAVLPLRKNSYFLGCLYSLGKEVVIVVGYSDYSRARC
jgi:hypothetical protein